MVYPFRKTTLSCICDEILQKHMCQGGIPFCNDWKHPGHGCCPEASVLVRFILSVLLEMWKRPVGSFGQVSDLPSLEHILPVQLKPGDDLLFLRCRGSSHSHGQGAS